MSFEVRQGDCVELMAAMPAGSVDSVICDPPYALQFMGRSWDRFDGASIDPAFGHWLAGFIDGEGCFHIHRKPQGTFDCQFSIALRGDDMPILERCHRETGLGTLALAQRGDGNPQGRWTVSSKAACLALRELLRAFPLRAKKALDFELWSGALDEWVAHKPGEWDSMEEIRSTLMESRAYAEDGVRVDPFQMWCWRWGREAMRVLKPGGHLLAMGGTRTVHRLTAGLEDAGFEIRDTICWLYGSGFPKSLDVSKAIDRAAGAEREVTGRANGAASQNTEALGPYAPEYDATAPATPEAERWEGWGTALKPAHEPVVVARKPLSGTVAQAVLEHGTGALNVDGCRVEGDVPTTTHGASVGDHIGQLKGRPLSEFTPNAAGRWPANVVLSHMEECVPVGTRKVKSQSPSVPQPKMNAKREGLLGPEGREPGMMSGGYADPDGTETVTAWRCHPDCPVRLLDEQTGELTSGSRAEGEYGRLGGDGRYSTWDKGPMPAINGDSGGASRFMKNVDWKHEEDECISQIPTEQESESAGFDGGGSVSGPVAIGDHSAELQGDRFRYVAKASRAERNAGLEGFEEGDERNYSGGPLNRPDHASSDGVQRSGARSPRANGHPTVKPISLMRWLVRLVTPRGGTICDPFCGSGSTGIAAVLEGFDFIGLERETEYVKIAEARIAWWHKHRGDGEAAEILAAGETRDAVEATGQLGMFD